GGEEGDEFQPPHGAYPKAQGSRTNYSTLHLSKKRGHSSPLWVKSGIRGSLTPRPLHPRKRTCARQPRDVRFVPKAVVSRCSNVKPELLNHLVGAQLERHWHV